MTEKKINPLVQQGLPFGRQQQVGNYLVLKYTKTLSAKELKILRMSSGAAQVAKERGINLGRGGVPYIKVSTVGGEWEIHFAANTTMFHYIDSRFTWKDGKCELDNESRKALYSLFLLFYGDTTIFGDAEYIENKGLCLKDFLERKKALGGPAANATGTVAGDTQPKTAVECTGKADDKAEDDAIIADMKKVEEAKANIIEMGKEATDGE